MEKGEIDLVWSEAFWNEFEHNVRKKALSTQSDGQAWERIVKASRKVMARYTTSFFIVSRFLPPLKRQMVEIIYAAVRYPDEVVDTFPLAAEERDNRLDRWEAAYERGLACNTLLEALENGVPAFVAAFTRVVLEKRIPPEHYRSFLSAMRHDIRPRTFETLEYLIDNYVYGSAVIVGYFLAYVYGPSEASQMEDVLACSRDLGIGLQLTNFLRDVDEDQRRGRLYLPLDMLSAVGIKVDNSCDLGELEEPTHHRKVQKVIHRMAKIADSYYRKSAQRLDAFAPDCRVAIKACMDVYRKLNEQIAASPDCISRRETVSTRQKFGALPTSKYWRLPLALLGW
ncbi:MAG: phytoene/squalene synthase family protein [Deltaproteobacteria bacterium]|nr:MAG: phytoene/squalene synthase family protein [Deltaproteobacteria bacterium]